MLAAFVLRQARVLANHPGSSVSAACSSAPASSPASPGSLRYPPGRCGVPRPARRTSLRAVSEGCPGGCQTPAAYPRMPPDDRSCPIASSIMCSASWRPARAPGSPLPLAGEGEPESGDQPVTGPPGLETDSHYRLRRVILVTIPFRLPTKSKIAGAEWAFTAPSWRRRAPGAPTGPDTGRQPRGPWPEKEQRDARHVDLTSPAAAPRRLPARGKGARHTPSGPLRQPPFPTPAGPPRPPPRARRPRQLTPSAPAASRPGAPDAATRPGHHPRHPPRRPGAWIGGYRIHVLDVITIVLGIAVLVAIFWPQ